MGDTDITMTDSVAVLTGDAPLTDARHLCADATVLIAVDGALDHALAAGLEPTIVVGDLDSIGDAALAWAEANAVIHRHEPDKDLTDTELALEVAAAFNPEHLVLVGGGGRLDHTLAAIGALGAERLTSIPTIDGWWDGHLLAVIHGPGGRGLDLPAGTTFSLLALQGAVRGLTVTGARWELDDATLPPSSGLGISNVATRPPVVITIHDGIVTAIVPPKEAHQP